MIEIFRTILFNVIAALYEPMGATIIITILFMTVYLYVQEKGIKTIVKHWVHTFKTKASFRKVCFLVFYTTMILFRTILYRHVWENPFSDVIGVWGLHNSNGDLTTEVIENLALFIPFTVLMLWSFRETILGQTVKAGRTMWQSVKNVFIFSLSIECVQLFFRLGTFQLSDLFYNTLGGLIGGLIYWCGYRIAHRKKSKNEE